MRAVRLEAFPFNLHVFLLRRSDLLARFPFLADRLQMAGSIHGLAPATIAQDPTTATIEARLIERVENISADIKEELKRDRILRAEERKKDRELRTQERKIERAAWTEELKADRARRAETIDAVERFADLQVEELTHHGVKMANILVELKAEFMAELAAVSSRMDGHEATLAAQSKIITVLSKAVMAMQGAVCSDLLKQMGVTGVPEEVDKSTANQDDGMTQVSFHPRWLSASDLLHVLTCYISCLRTSK